MTPIVVGFFAGPGFAGERRGEKGEAGTGRWGAAEAAPHRRVYVVTGA